MRTVLTTQHLIFKQYAPNRYYVYSAHDATLLGDIYYLPKWRRFIFEPSHDVIFDSECLSSIISFLNHTTYARSEK